MHFGFIINEGSWDCPCICVAGDTTVCGCESEEVLEEYTTDNWKDVTCKKCLKLKDKVIANEKRDEEIIVKQMGEMADFMNAKGTP
jgi:hypothetical protein